MQIIRSFFSRITLAVASISWISILCLSGCSGKQQADQDWVDSVLEECDCLSEDSLVYDVEDTPLSEAVDENFNDFFYTFTHNKTFRLSRVQFPVSVVDHADEELRMLKNQRDFEQEFAPTSNDYYVLLLNDVAELADDPASQIQTADVDLVDLHNEHVRRFACARTNGQWKLLSEKELAFSSHPVGGFLDFYYHFEKDSVFRIDHVAQPLSISMPEEDDESDDESELIEGTIDADQFPVFAPELPQGKIIMMDYGLLHSHPSRVVMVKCGMASSMMEMMTFERDEEGWKLVKLEM